MKKALDSNLDFDGMAGDGVNRSGDRFAGNHFGEHMKENFGAGPRNAAHYRKEAKYEAKSPATFDKFREAPDRASGKKPNEGPFEHLHFANPDKINVGMK